MKVDVGEVPPRPPHWVMYTVKPPPSPTHLGLDALMATLRQPWWSIPEGGRWHMHAFTRPSQQLRSKVRHALLRSLHYTSLYRRLILKNLEVGTNPHCVREAIHRRLAASASEGSSLLKFTYGQLYNGKIAKGYGHAPTHESPFCHKPDSCTHIAGECPHHKALTISLHNAACQLVHAAIWKFAKGGGGASHGAGLSLRHGGCGFIPTYVTSLTGDALCSTQYKEETIADGTLDSALPTEERVDDRGPHTYMD
jgi:hypothetical protein